MLSTRTLMSPFEERPACQCGSEECRPKILHSILSYKYPNSTLSLDNEDSMEKKCHRSVYSPSGSTGSCYNSPRHSPVSSPNAAAAQPSSPSPPTNSKLFLLLNGQASDRRSPAPHAGAARGQYPRVVPSPVAASTCNTASDGYLYPPRLHEQDEEQPLNLKRSFHQSLSTTPSVMDAPDQPIDLSYKKRKLSISSQSSSDDGFKDFKIEAVSPYRAPNLEASDNDDSILKSILCGQRGTRQVASPTPYSLPPSPLSQQSTASFRDSNTSSILSGILYQNRLEGVTGDSLSGSRCSTPGSTCAHSVNESQSSSQFLTKNKQTVVTLAKKNLFPVTARVSDWLVKIVQFAKSQPEFTNLTHTDQVGLILHSWGRILLLFMAETNFEFAVTPKGPPHQQFTQYDEEHQLPGPNTPTMRHVETIQRFILKCQSLGLDQQEYSYLKMITLFNPGYLGKETSEYVESVNTLVRQSLQRYIQRVHPSSKMRYSQLLLSLPTLFAIDCKMMENLFCRHIIGEADMEVLLKEMLQKLSEKFC